MEGPSALPGPKDLFPEHFLHNPSQVTHHPLHPHPSSMFPRATPGLGHSQDVTYSQSQPHPYSPPPPPPQQQQQQQRASKRPYDAQKFTHRARQRHHDGVAFAARDFDSGNGVVMMHQHSGGHAAAMGGESDEQLGDGEDGEEEEGDNASKRRHPCPRCGKRFNRPSSLKIHLNTHTGLKPFACPFPGCGRAFNVSSNMRRHYRNHTKHASASMPILPVVVTDAPIHERSVHPQSVHHPYAAHRECAENRNASAHMHTRNAPHASDRFYPPSSSERSQYQHPPTPPYTNDDTLSPRVGDGEAFNGGGGEDAERRYEFEFEYGLPRSGMQGSGGYGPSTARLQDRTPLRMSLPLGPALRSYDAALDDDHGHRAEAYHHSRGHEDVSHASPYPRSISNARTVSRAARPSPLAVLVDAAVRDDDDDDDAHERQAHRVRRRPTHGELKQQQQQQPSPDTPSMRMRALCDHPSAYVPSRAQAHTRGDSSPPRFEGSRSPGDGGAHGAWARSSSGSQSSRASGRDDRGPPPPPYPVYTYPPPAPVADPALVGAGVGFDAHSESSSMAKKQRHI